MGYTDIHIHNIYILYTYIYIYIHCIYRNPAGQCQEKHSHSPASAAPEIPYSASDCKTLDELEAWHQRPDARDVASVLVERWCQSGKSSDIRGSISSNFGGEI